MKKKGIIAIISAAVVVFVLIIAIVGGVALLPLAKLFSKEKLSISDIQANCIYRNILHRFPMVLFSSFPANS